MYVAADPENRALMPFGLRGKPGEANFDLFQEALMEALVLAQVLRPPQSTPLY